MTTLTGPITCQELLRGLPGPDEGGGEPSMQRQARAHQAARQPRPAGGKWSPGSRAGSGGRCRASTRWMCWSSPAITVSRHRASRPFRLRSPRRWSANFQAGGAAINQIATGGRGAAFSVVPLVARPADRGFHGGAGDDAARNSGRALAAGYRRGGAGHAICSASAKWASAIPRRRRPWRRRCSAARPRDWAGRGTGLDAAGVAHKAAVVERALALHGEGAGRPVGGCAPPRRAGDGGDPGRGAGRAPAQHSGAARWFCLFGGCGAARAKLLAGGLDHAMVGHVSAEAGHRAPGAGAGAAGDCSISTCGWARAPARRSRSISCARPRLPQRHGDLCRGWRHERD